MKIIFLNAWHARQTEAMTAFLQQNVLDTDVFCFQEAGDQLRAICRKILINYKLAFTNKNISDDEGFSQAICLKKDLPVLSSAAIGLDIEMSGIGQYVRVPFGSQRLNICNFHGLSRPNEKLDTPDRLKQSKLIIDFFSNRPGFTIIGGDFNLTPNTESINLFEQNGYRNLIKDFNVKTTRNHLAWDRFTEKYDYSDYVFTSPRLKIKSFKVPNIEISDHLPLMVELS